MFGPRHQQTALAAPCPVYPSVTAEPTLPEVSKVPFANVVPRHSPRQFAFPFAHLVGALLKLQRHVQAQHLGGSFNRLGASPGSTYFESMAVTRHLRPGTDAVPRSSTDWITPVYDLNFPSMASKPDTVMALWRLRESLHRAADCSSGIQNRYTALLPCAPLMPGLIQ